MARPPPPPSRRASPRPPHPNEGRASFSEGSTRRRGDAEIKDIRAERAEFAEKKGGEAANLIFSAPPRLRVNKDLCVLCALCANSVRDRQSTRLNSSPYCHPLPLPAPLPTHAPPPAAPKPPRKSPPAAPKRGQGELF